MSYTQVDQVWAEWIAWLLEEDGYRVLVQVWDMVAGSNWTNLVDQGVQRAERTVAVLSPDYLSSKYGAAEWQAAWANDPQGLQRKLIPVRVRGERPSGLLAGVVDIDLVGVSEAAARRLLRDGIAAAVQGPVKPGSPPPFPLALRAVPTQPRFPDVRVLQPPAVFWDAQEISLPGRDAPLVGRDDELGRLRTALAPATDSPRNRVVVVEGPGGIGKTRLVVEAGRASSTLIARTGAALSVDELVDVPVNVPSVIFVDDAHRSPDLSGLAAIVGDPRFAGVTVVLTVRSGLADPTLRRAGLDNLQHTTITLGPLSRSKISEIVSTHGITGEAFHLHVIDIAEGNPLIAHSACELATQQGTYNWQDTRSVLRELFKIRLSHLRTDGHEHRAAAVALAILTTAQSSEQLTALIGAVQGLPPDPHRLREILMDLADARIVDGPPFTLRPDALGPMIVADALADGERVGVGLTRTLRALGRAACWGSGAGEDSDGPGLLGIGSPRPGADGALAGMHATVLASQLGVLAQAAHLTGRDADLCMLSRAVRQLLSGQTDTTRWLDVLVLANAIAPYRPPLLGELRDELIRQWPPRPGQNLWGDEPAVFYRREVEWLLEQAASLAQRVGRGDQRRAVSWILECAWLAYPVISSVKLESLRQTITSLIWANGSDRTWDAVFARRDQVLRSVLQWGKDRFAESPAALGESERAVRGAGETAHVVLAAVRPFLSVVRTTVAFGTPQDPDVYRVGKHVLPDDPRTARQLHSAVDAVRRILDKIDPASPEVQPVLREIATLSRELRVEGARAGTTGPVPAYAVKALHSAADALADAVAEHWAALPLSVRHSAAAAAVRPAGRRPTTLAALAEAGDAVAVAALRDTELGRILVLFPISEGLDCIARGGTDAASLENERRQKAEELGEQLPFEEAIELLESLDEPPSALFGPGCLEAFAVAIGRRAPTADAILTRLTAGPLVGEYALLAGLLQSAPDAVFAWILGNITVPRIGVLGLAIAGMLAEDQETTLLDAIATVLTTAGASPTSVEPNTDGPDPLSASTELAALASTLARHLAGSRQRPVSDRLKRLADLGETGPAAVLPRVLSAVGQVLRPIQTQFPVAVDHPDLRRRLVAVLGRALAATDHDMLSDVQYDTAMGGLALAVVAPAEVAELLIERTLADLPHVISMEWHRLLADMDFADRTPVAEAFWVLLEQQRAAGTITARRMDTAHWILTQLGGGTEQWVTRVRALATGSPTDRTRAAQIIRFSWHHAVWAEVVPDLVDAGLDEHTTDQLYEGLLMDNVDYDLDDATQAKLDVLQPLLNDSRPAVREFAGDATRRLSSPPSL
ncbi:MAG: TIR domain-containing protein [Pseudonocardiaceae bacterium]